MILPDHIIQPSIKKCLPKLYAYLKLKGEYGKAKYILIYRANSDKTLNTIKQGNFYSCKHPREIYHTKEFNEIIFSFRLKLLSDRTKKPLLNTELYLK